MGIQGTDTYFMTTMCQHWLGLQRFHHPENAHKCRGFSELSLVREGETKKGTRDCLRVTSGIITEVYNTYFLN